MERRIALLSPLPRPDFPKLGTFSKMLVSRIAPGLILFAVGLNAEQTGRRSCQFAWTLQQYVSRFINVAMIM